MIVNNLRVEDICEFIGGSQPAKSEFINEAKEGYVRLIQTRDYKTDAFPTYIPENSTRKFCDIDDVMIGRYGPPIFQICRGLKGAYNVALLKAKPKKDIDREFLYYFLKQDAVFQYVDKLSARTGGQTGVDLVSLNKYPVRVPSDIVDQKKLVASLVAIDKKIELNNRINAELEAMAKTLYDYWFVQFDFPDANGKPYKTAGGKMVYNEVLKREIPEGWEPVSVGKIVDIKTGKEDANYATESGKYHFFTCGESALRCDDFVFEGKAVLLAGNGSFSVKRYEGKFNAYQRTYVLIPKQDELYAPLYFAVNDKVKMLTAGSRGSIVKFITKGDIEDIYLPLPTNKKLEFVRALNACFKESSRLYEQNLELVSLRDWLLPMLMNGQVTVT